MKINAYFAYSSLPLDLTNLPKINRWDDGGYFQYFISVGQFVKSSMKQTDAQLGMNKGFFFEKSNKNLFSVGDILLNCYGNIHEKKNY